MNKKIHMVFKTHLDVGFTDFAGVVVDRYLNQYIPAAIKAARELRETNRPERFIWTTGSWLIYTSLERATPAGRREIEDAITAGDLTWHALPFTTHSELMDAGLFRHALSLSQRLDRRFGIKTIAAKLTDVPGHTRAIIPLLAEAGIQFLHIGVNAASTVPLVPPLFRWQSPDGAEIMVMVESGYGKAFSINGIDDCLVFSHTNDNIGPQTTDQVLDSYQELRLAYPGDQVCASTLDNFARALMPIRNTLPVIQAEIGDTWIHGVGSDPIKVSQYRELLRLRTEWLAANPALILDERFLSFMNRLLLIPEHTWGMDEKTFLADHQNYSAAEFQSARHQENFQIFQSSWAEKRAYIQSAVDELADTPLGLDARTRLESIRPHRPDLREWQPLKFNDADLVTPHFVLRFNSSSGSVSTLVTRRDGRSWADADHPLAALFYQTFSAADYERFFNQYIRPGERNNGWSREDFTKPGLELAHPIHRLWYPQVSEAYTQKSTIDIRFLFHLKGDYHCVRDYGYPQDFYLEYILPDDHPGLKMNLKWFNKPACRMPEALWLKFNPITSAGAAWKMQKMDQWISPLDVLENGNRHLHAVDCTITCADQGTLLRICPLDSPLVAPGEPSLLNFTNDQPDLKAGVHFNLYNNVWGTNFPMWFDEDCLFRFRLDFHDIGSS